MYKAINCKNYNGELKILQVSVRLPLYTYWYVFMCLWTTGRIKFTTAY